MNMQTILAVEDDEAIRDMIAFNLDRAGFRVIEAGDCQSARVRIAEDRPDLLLLDWMLPDTSGIELARSLRRDEVTRDLPIIMLTARTMEDDKVRGLDSGVDDYITKPFGARELIARINALLRRAAPGGADEEIEADGLVLNTASHRVTGNGRPIELGPTEFRMLKFFMTHQDRVYSRNRLLDYVWGGGVYIEERTVDVHILRLRKALAPFGFDRYIQTVRGAGYRFSVSASG
ncbi:MAG: phosphate regulon transcriptional regulator PhoB [Pseudomonadota bacterium]|nr:MAG: phosphate regulon transcriptional regulator PhoB [Pseudomonadota bacterium]